MKPDSLHFYEVNLSNCDGLNCDVHVWSDGTHEIVKGTRYAFRKLLRYFHDADASQFVRDWHANQMAKRATN